MLLHAGSMWLSTDWVVVNEICDIWTHFVSNANFMADYPSLRHSLPGNIYTWGKFAGLDKIDSIYHHLCRAWDKTECTQNYPWRHFHSNLTNGVWPVIGGKSDDADSEQLLPIHQGISPVGVRQPSWLSVGTFANLGSLYVWVPRLDEAQIKTNSIWEMFHLWEKFVFAPLKNWDLLGKSPAEKVHVFLGGLCVLDATQCSSSSFVEDSLDEEGISWGENSVS